jgi:hypothetical protein
MRRAPVLLLLAALSACGGNLNSTVRGSTLTPPSTVYECVQQQLETLGYRRMQYDTDAHWYLAQRVDPTDRVSSGLYLKTVDRIDAKVRPDASGATSLELGLKTVQIYSTAAGDREEEKPASSNVKRDAATIAAACATK